MVEDLQHGTYYYFTVTPFNSIGSGATSLSSKAIKAMSIPPAPTSVAFGDLVYPINAVDFLVEAEWEKVVNYGKILFLLYYLIIFFT